MEFLSPNWLIAGAIIVIIIWTNERLRALLLLGLALFILMATAKALLHRTGCGAGDCLVALQPTWAGPCFPLNGGAVLKTNGNYYLTSSDAAGAATCLDLRFWR